MRLPQIEKQYYKALDTANAKTWSAIESRLRELHARLKNIKITLIEVGRFNLRWFFEPFPITLEDQGIDSEEKCDKFYALLDLLEIGVTVGWKPTKITNREIAAMREMLELCNWWKHSSMPDHIVLFKFKD